MHRGLSLMTRDDRVSAQAERDRLKAAYRRAIARAGGGDSFQFATRVQAPALSRYASPGHPDHHMPGDVILEVDREAGSPIIARILANAQGYGLHRLPETVSGEIGSEDCARLMTEAGEAVSALGRAVAAGACAADRQELEREVEDLRGVLDEIKAKLARTGG